ncbi:hypothetical protein IG521_02925 [Vibrio cholerae]|uniref:hypothetical protein n=1 Tax=Vibrio cholerae TaxID=666 RepID=UPI002271EA2D|nr:hypothetical protein [Vibrio cholerae]MCX9597398.1 hypothetical protein [Vibrio cholerae]
MKAPEKSLSLLKVSNLFEFMGVKHPVFVDEETKAELIYTKGLVDQIGIDWRTQRNKLVDHDGYELHATALYKSTPILEEPRLLENDFEQGGNEVLGTKIGSEFDLVKPKEGIYIEIQRVHIFLARLSTAQIRSQGNTCAADYILSLQQEWADALYSYETKGVAIKSSKHKASIERAAALDKWLKMQKSASNDSVKAYIEKEINALIKQA